MADKTQMEIERDVDMLPPSEAAPADPVGEPPNGAAYLPALAGPGSVPGVRFNPAAGVPVTTVFMHGVLASTSMWKGVVAPPLADEAAALPLPGHFPWALSPAETDEALEGLAFIDLYRDWLDANAAGPVHMIGHSAGSIATLKFAARYPDRVSRLTLLGTFADGSAAIADSTMARTVTLPVVGGAVFQQLYALWLGSLEWFDAGLATAKPPTLEARPITRAEQSMLADLRRSDAEAMRRVVLWLQRTSVEDDLPKIATPTTVLICQDDPVVSIDKQMKVVRALPNANAIVSHVGHLPMFEQPEIFRRLLRT